MGIACETSWCLGLAGSFLLVWGRHGGVECTEPGPDPTFPTFPSWLSQNGVSMGKEGDSLGMKVWRTADTMGLVSSASPSPGCHGVFIGHNRIRPEAARVRLIVQQDLPDPFRMLNCA